MTCPRCAETLEPTIRDGIEIDRCPRCHGLWLDRGELEKMIGRIEGEYRRNRGDDRGFDDDDDDDGDLLEGLFGGRLRGELLDFD